MKITTAILEDLKGVPREALKRFPVDGHRGLYLQVTKNGVLSWVFRYRGLLKTERTYTIGTYPEVSASTAKTKATALWLEVKEGKDPSGGVDIMGEGLGRVRRLREAAERKAAREAERNPPPPPAPVVEPLTLAKVAETFYEEHVKVENKPSYIKEQRWRLDKYILPGLGQIKITEIKVATVTSFLAQVSKDHPVTSNHLAVTLSKMFNWASRRFTEIEGFRNPVQGHKKAKETPRGAYLDEANLRMLGKAWRESMDPRKYAVIFPLITGCRKGAVMNLGKGSVDKKAGLLRFDEETPGLKGCRTIYLTTPALALLEKIPEDGATAEVLDKGWQKLRAESEVQFTRNDGTVEDITLHDMRRTFATVGAGLKIPPHLLDIIIGHTQEKLRKTYQIQDDAILLAEAEKVSARIAELLGIGPVKKAAKVVKPKK